MSRKLTPKIRELATQAGMRECALGYGMPENVLWGEDEIDRFASILIQEVCDLMNHPHHIGRVDLDWEIVIKDHFKGK